jgi:hypothetical protein
MFVKKLEDTHFVIVFNLSVKLSCGSPLHRPEAPTKISMLTRVTDVTEKLPVGHGVVDFNFTLSSARV